MTSYYLCYFTAISLLILYVAKSNDLNLIEISQEAKVRFAICVTGQLVRLELGSKIKNLISTNLVKGYHISLFILLDNDIEHIKAVKFKRRHTSKTSLYAKFSNDTLYSLIFDQVAKMAPTENFKLYTRLEPPFQANFLVNKDLPPPVTPPDKDDGDKKAFERFQNHMR